MAKNGFTLYKWHSNIPSLETPDCSNNEELTDVQNLFQSSEINTKILGLGWDKASDRLHIIFLKNQKKLATKRNILSYVAAVIIPLGLISPNDVIEKVTYYELSYFYE